MDIISNIFYSLALIYKNILLSIAKGGFFMTDEFQKILLSMKPKSPRMIALANAVDVNALSAIINAHELGFVNAILCGDENEIKSVAKKNNLNISDFEIVHCSDELTAATMAVSLVRNGRAEILMKGLIHSADILRAVLNRESGIRGDGILSHVSVMHSPSRKHRLFLTDVAMVMYPDLSQKVQLVKNAVELAHRMGIACPRVAPLCAVETLNPAMQATVDADALHKMNERGEISGCIISGPIGLDIAVSATAAKIKGIHAPIAGDADILLFDNIEAANNVVKSMVHFGDWIFGGVIIGARAPIVLNSRSDSDMSKLFSICIACTM